MSQGLESLRIHNFERAAQLFEIVTDIDPYFAEVLFFLDSAFIFVSVGA